MAPIGQITLETEKLIKLFCEAKNEGDMVTYEEMNAAVGFDLRKEGKSGRIRTAIEHAEYHLNCMFANERNVGYVHLNAKQEVGDIIGGRKKAIRTTKKVVKRTRYCNWGAYDEDDRATVNANRVLLSLFLESAKRKNMEAIEEKTRKLNKPFSMKNALEHWIESS